MLTHVMAVVNLLTVEYLFVGNPIVLRAAKLLGVGELC